MTEEKFQQQTIILKETNHFDEIELKDILRQLWLKRKFILSVTGIFLLFGIFVALISPVQYTAQSTIFTQSGGRGSAGNLGNIASIAGINIGTSVIQEGNISPALYPEIIKSLPFVREIMQVPIVVEKSEGKEITLYEYYSNPKYKGIDILNNIKKYTIGLPRTIVASFRSKSNQNSVATGNAIESDITNNGTNIVKMTSREQSVYNAIKNGIVYDHDAKKGIITIGYTFPEALAAAQVSDQLHKSLEKYVVNYRIEKVRGNLAFVEKSYIEAQKDFLQKQADLAAFQDSNRGLVTATGRATETRLRSEYDIAFTVYNELAKQREQAQLAVNETKPVLIVLDPVTVPLQKSAPSPKRIMAVFIFLGLIISCSWIYLFPVIKEITQKVEE
ncbi:MAG: Wzz/FepE/Etk N-terminal domain-containing protein [Bacteroidales bacterium]|jgi:uncharacterized protein involved in exopolysaccharide biosynthesis|nr:Wzz/FepE/Etk N-terminal domain-containing protein [Bacteroidales bacterium]